MWINYKEREFLKIVVLSVLLLCSVLSLPMTSWSAPGDIATVAGGSVGDGSAAISAITRYPYGVAVDGAGNIYITDTWNNRIRMVNASTGLITTVAGNGTSGFSGDNSAATSA